MQDFLRVVRIWLSQMIQVLMEMMLMKKILKNKKGFTLIEMLIVVAIVVILAAISIPTFSADLRDASASTDAANIRAAKAAAIAYMMENSITSTGVYYDAIDGVIVTTKPSEGYGQTMGNKGKVIIITWNESTGTYDYEWE